MLLLPVSENVSLLELLLPVMVSVPPLLLTEAVAESKLTNSVFPDWMIVSSGDGDTPDAEKVARVCLARRPVCSDADHDTVSFPLPLVLFGFLKLKEIPYIML